MGREQLSRVTLISLVYLLHVFAAESLACTTIIAGKKATTNGAIIVARNSDSGKAVNSKHLIVHQSRINLPDAVFRSNSNDFSYPLTEVSLRYLGLPYWYAHNESMEQVVCNNYGVALSSTETITNSDEVLKVDPYVKKTGITEDSIASVIIQRVKTAREGIELLGHIVSTKGAGEGFGVAIADKNEVWYLETASGHHWAAVKVPDEAYFVSANQGRIQDLDPHDKANYLLSHGLIEFAEENKLYNPKTDRKFNFRKAFARIIPGDVQYNYLRIYTVIRKFNPEFTADFKKGEFPTFLKPAKLISKNDVASALRNHYEGTDNDPYTLENPEEPYRPIAVLRQSNSHITETRSNAAPGIDVVQYISLGMNALGVYIPFYSGIRQVPSPYLLGADKASDDSAFWVYRKLQVLAMRNFKAYAPIIQKEYFVFEENLAARQAQMEEKYNELYKTDPIAALTLLQRFSDQTIEEALTLTKNLTNTVFTLETEAMDKKYHFEGS